MVGLFSIQGTGDSIPDSQGKEKHKQNNEENNVKSHNILSLENQSRWQESNLRQADYKSATLPTELQKQDIVFKGHYRLSP